jgi:hypothetical protein
LKSLCKSQQKQAEERNLERNRGEITVSPLFSDMAILKKYRGDMAIRFIAKRCEKI